VKLRARWVRVRARWVTLRARWVILRARWVTLRARWVMLIARWVTLRARWVTLRARWVTLTAFRKYSSNSALACIALPKMTRHQTAEEYLESLDTLISDLPRVIMVQESGVERVQLL
jgi:hypothetical protein